MLHPTIMGLLGLISLTSAAPLVAERSTLLNSRDGPCSPQNMQAGVDDFSCNKKFTLDNNGHCSAIPDAPGDAGCSAYCEIRLTLVYGQEVPFSQGSCQSGTTCRVDTSKSVTVTTGYSINAGIDGGIGDDVTKLLTAAFNFGATYSWSESIGYTTTESKTKELDGSTCGYWTFIPYLFSSCGTLTVAEKGSTPMYGGVNTIGGETYETCVKDKLTDTPNWCNTTPYKDENGHADGKIVFVYSDCATGKVDPNDSRQDPAYKFPGVSTAQH